MLKILYAAGRNQNAKIQLARFLASVDVPCQMKVAAFKCSSPKNTHIDWTLDCLLDIFNPEVPYADNNNLAIYYDQVKSFSPDLVISDLEHFTSHIANLLNIPLWQCSSSLISFALSKHQKAGSRLRNRYAYLLERYSDLPKWQTNIINNSDRNFIYSHFGDVSEPPEIKINFEWIKPYHQIGKKSVPCQHNLVAGTLRNNKLIFDLLQRHTDSVAFTEFPYERYPNFRLKSIANQEEYFCNLSNSNLFFCEGQTSFLADAFYNGKHSGIMINFQDLECVTNAIYSEYFGLSTCVYDPAADLTPIINKTVSQTHYSQTRFLHERLNEL